MSWQDDFEAIKNTIKKADRYDQLKADAEKLVEALKKYEQMQGRSIYAVNALKEWREKYGDSNEQD